MEIEDFNDSWGRMEKCICYLSQRMFQCAKSSKDVRQQHGLPTIEKCNTIENAFDTYK